MLKILVVDDEIDIDILILQRFRQEIRQQQYSFLFAHDGVEALNVVSINPDVALVITDINMPAMDGYELLRNLRESYSNIKVIIISAYNNSIEMINQGAQAFITKPIDFIELKQLVESVYRISTNS